MANAVLQGYHFFVPQNAVDKETLGELVYFTQKHSGYVQAWYDRADPKDITNINCDKKTFQALKTIPAEY